MGKVTIASSSLNLPYRTALTGSVELHEAFLHEAGYAPGSEVSDNYQGGGFEWHEIRNGRYLGSKVVPRTLAILGKIASVHQSWRSTHWWQPGANLAEARTVLEVAQSAGTSLAIPFIDNSLNRLAEVKGPKGKLLPVVAHPNQQQRPDAVRFSFDYRAYEGLFAQVRHQPTAETLRAWGVLSPNANRMAERMIKKQADYGFNGVAWDTQHSAEERYGDRDLRIPDPFEMITALGRLGGLQEIQINLTQEGDIDRILKGGLKFGPHGQMLEAALGSVGANELLIVTEVHPSQITGDTAEQHRELVTAISDMLPAAA